jgi:hypothetical protein
MGQRRSPHEARINTAAPASLASFEDWMRLRPRLYEAGCPGRNGATRPLSSTAATRETEFSNGGRMPRV